MKKMKKMGVFKELIHSWKIHKNHDSTWSSVGAKVFAIFQKKWVWFDEPNVEDMSQGDKYSILNATRRGGGGGLADSDIFSKCRMNVRHGLELESGS